MDVELLVPVSLPEEKNPVERDICQYNLLGGYLPRFIQHPLFCWSFAFPEVFEIDGLGPGFLRCGWEDTTEWRHEGSG
jgi:hypothetical protein